MPPLRSVIPVVLALGALAWADPGPSGPMRTDRYGDPLPPGAAMRLGTVRYRHGHYLGHLAYTPDGRSVVTSDGRRHLQVWDARDGRKLRQIDAGIEAVRDFAVSPDGKAIAAVGFQYEPGRNLVIHYLSLIDAATGRPVRRGEWDERGDVWRMAYAPDGRSIATASEDGTIRLWDVLTPRVFHQERLAEWHFPAIAFSPDPASRLLAIASERGIHLRDLTGFREVRTFPILREYRPTGLAFSPDGATLAVGMAGVSSEIGLWRVEDGSLVRWFSGRKEADVLQLAFSPDGRWLTARLQDGHLALYNVELGNELLSLSNVRLADGPMAFSPDGKTLATTGDQHVLHLWDVATGEDRLATPEAHQGGVRAFAFLDGGRRLVSGSDDRTVRLWDLATGRPTRTLAHDGWVRSLAASVDGSLLATASSYPGRGKVYLWDLKRGQRLHVWSAGGDNPALLLRGITLGGDGSSVIAAWGDGSLRIWDVATGKERPTVPSRVEKGPPPDPQKPRARNEVDEAVFSRDGRSAALIGLVQARVVDTATGDLLFEAPCWDAAPDFAPDGRSLAIVRLGRGKEIKLADGHVRGDSSTAPSTIVWLDSRSGHVRREIEVPESRVDRLAFSPDGQLIAAATSFHWERGIIRIFRLRDKREIQAIETPCPWIQGLAFTPDGKQIVAGLSDTSIVIWDIRSPE